MSVENRTRSAYFYSAAPSASRHALAALAVTGVSRIGVRRDHVFAWALNPTPASLPLPADTTMVGDLKALGDAFSEDVAERVRG